MKIIKNLILGLSVLLCFSTCEKRAIPPDSNQLSFPRDFKAVSNFQAIKLFWTAIDQKDIAGYKIYYGAASKSYTDTIFASSEISSIEIKDLQPDQQFFCAISTVDVNHKESELSDEINTRTYIAFEDFAQQDEQLDSTRWHYEIGYSVPVIEQKVAAAEVQFNDVRVRRSFGQYLNYTPVDDFVVECDFKLGTPNVGGAGLMIRSQLANPEKYYKGYNAFIFWNFNNWELRLEESLVDRFAMPNATPAMLPDIHPDEWVKLSMLYKEGSIEAAVFRLPDYSVLGTVEASDSAAGRRPSQSDKYCGFFTTQYGANIIYADNFGIRRLD
jgi:hypothetical protein